MFDIALLVALLPLLLNYYEDRKWHRPRVLAKRIVCRHVHRIVLLCHVQIHQLKDYFEVEENEHGDGGGVQSLIWFLDDKVERERKAFFDNFPIISNAVTSRMSLEMTNAFEESDRLVEVVRSILSYLKELERFSLSSEEYRKETSTRIVYSGDFVTIAQKLKGHLDALAEFPHAELGRSLNCLYQKGRADVRYDLTDIHPVKGFVVSDPDFAVLMADHLNYMVEAFEEFANDVFERIYDRYKWITF